MSEQDLIKRHLEVLHKHFASGDSEKCTQTIELLSEFFDVTLSDAKSTYSIELLFKWDDYKISITQFLAASMSSSKQGMFSDCNKKVFVLIEKIIGLYPSKIIPFSKSIVDFGVLSLNNGKSTATEKESAAAMIHALMEKNAFDANLDISQLIASVLKVLEQKKPPIRLQQHVYELLGLLSKIYPKKFSITKADELRNKMINTIQSLYKDDKASTSLILISGVVEGLKNHLINFTPTPDGDPQFGEKLYDCMLNLTDPQKLPSGSTSNRVAFRKMLQVVHLYGSIHNIPKFLFRDFKQWHRILTVWMRSSSYEDKSAGVLAMQTFHQIIAAVIDERRNDEDKDVLLFFMNYFKDTLENSNSQPNEIRIAIKGFGSMAAVCKILLESKYLNDCFDLVIQRTEYSYLTKDRLLRREILEHLPNYVESLSKIMYQLDEISGIQLQSLESIIVILIKDFHYLSTAHHALVAVALLETFSNLQKLDGKILEKVLESVVLQGILWTCSHQLLYDLQDNLDNVTDWKETITYKRYLPLWRRLLAPESESHQEISSIIYNHFIRNLFFIINKLDLSTQKRKYYDDDNGEEQEFFFSDPSLDLEPVRAENFQILYNLVQFYSEIILEQPNECLQKNFVEWLEIWLDKTIALSLNHPLVSGFLQLIEMSLKVIDKLDFASNIDNHNARRVINPLKFYIKSMLFMRCQQTSGELQIACLQLIFQVPTVILKDFDDDLSQIFKIGFEVGKGLISLAHYALTSFERIIDSLSDDPKTRRKMLEEVLPKLEPYLSSHDSGVKKIVHYVRGRKKNKTMIHETDLLRFKKRVLLLLGQLSPDESQLVLSTFQQKLVRDHVTNIFNVRLNCDEDAMPVIYLDDSVLRICELALSSSERATKISACELLHGLVLYMMGKSLNSLSTLPLWKELCCNLIVLGAESDQTVRQLFELLLMQMVHFFAQPSKILDKMATILVESLLKMICYRGNNGVQDLSARLLREFLLWVNKKADPLERQASPIKLVDMFHEMRKMSMETDASRRMGATLAFNNIYRIIREDDALVDVYWLYLLELFATNFKSSEDFSSNLDSNFADGRRLEQVSTSMDHLVRVFEERSDIFERSNTNRIRPSGFDGIKLIDVIKWLFKECGKPQYHYRHKCMEMFVKILPRWGTKRDFYEQNCSIAKILEVSEKDGIAKYPDLSCFKECNQAIFESIYKWMQSLLTTLDFDIWLIGNEFIPSYEIGEFLSTSTVLSSISYFLKNVVGKNIIDVITAIDENLFNESQLGHEADLNNRNIDNINSIVAIIMVRVIDLLTTLVRGKHVNQFLRENMQLVEITSQLIYSPQDLGFDYKSKNPLLKLRHRITSFMTTISEHAPIDFKSKLIKELTNSMMVHLNRMCQNRESFEDLLDEATIRIPEVARLYGVDLLITNMRPVLEIDCSDGERLLNVTAKTLLEKLFEGITEIKAGVLRPRHLSPSAKAFATNIFSLCLKIDLFLNKILIFSFNDTTLKISPSRSVRHGELFMQTFKEPIMEYCTSMLTDTIQSLVSELPAASTTNRLRIFDRLTELNEFIFDQHKDNETILSENVNAMIAQWPTIIKVALEMDNNLNCIDLALIDLVKHMAMTSPIELEELGRRLETFQSWLFNLLENRNNSLEIKSKAVFLLPCVTGSTDKINEKLMKALDSIQQRHIPLRSHETVEGSLERAGLVALMNAFFQALLSSRSPVVYRFLINITISDDNYIMESDLQRVQVDLMKSLNAVEQEVLVSQTFDAFTDEKYSPDIRLSFVSRFLLTIMKNCQIDVMMNFMRQKIGAVWSLTETPLTTNTEHSLVNRCGGYMMIEAFVALVPRNKIEAASYSYGGKVSKGTDLVKEIIRKMKDVRQTMTFMVEDPVQQELFRKFHCYYYRALAATVCNTKDTPELYNLSLFKENPQKGAMIWQKMINIKNENLYANWEQDFAELPRIKEYIVSVKDLQASNHTTPNRKYIDTISIFDRSLSQSLTKTDLTYSVVLSNREALERQQQRQEDERQNTMKVELESTPINEHEIMSVLVAVIRHIHKNKISPHTNLDKIEPKKFEWVVSLASSIRDSTNHKNVRIFLAKLVDNCRDIFVYYAKQLTGAILSVIVDECLGNKMNFFIADLVTMMLSWSHIYKPADFTEKQDACALLKFLIENAYNSRDEIFKLNLELIKKLVEIWSEVLSEKIPTQTLLDLLTEQTLEGNQKLRSGIQLNAVLLANDIVPWSNVEQQHLFINAIVKAFDNSSPHIYQAAAQLCGMCLNKMSEDEREELVEQITKRLEKIQKKSSDVNTFLQILYGIQKAFPSILDSFMTSVKLNIAKAVRKVKCIYLEMFLARLEIEGDHIFREVVAIGTKDLLKQSEYQLLALHILNKALPYLKAKEFQMFVEELSVLAQSPRVDIRTIVYEMMIFAVQTYQNDDNFLKPLPMQIILKGFTDSNEQIQNRVVSYLSVEGGLSKKFHERFQELLEKFYHPSLEKEFLHYATQLLLDIPIRHPRSKNLLLDYDHTKDREFYEYSITTKSNSQRSLPPMFIQSQQKSLLAGDGSMYNQLVRATLVSGGNQVFSPTLDPIKMTQVSQTFAFKQTQDSLFFSLKPKFLDRRSKPCEAEKLDPEQEIARNKEGTQLNALDYLRKRIVRKEDQEKSKIYALKAIDKRNFYQAREAAKVRQSREGKEAVLYRRYRLGELPDFFFNHLAVLLPLQALAKNDPVVARDAFLSIFQAIDAIFEESNSDIQDSFFATINNSIMNILKQSKNSDSFFIGTLIEMTMKSEKYLEISPEVLANVASQNNMLVTGALFLESQLIHLLSQENDFNDEGQPLVKRQKIDIDTTQLKHWLKLIELYYEMNEYEVIVGIFTEKLNLQPEVRDTLISAIDQESKGKYADASRVYENIIRAGSARNNNEKEFYYQSYFNCLANLSDWRNIAKEIETQLNSYDEAWDEAVPFHQQTFLPHLMKSELRIILDLKLGGTSENDGALDEFLRILENWLNDETKCDYLRNRFPEIVSMLHVVDEKFAESSVEAENALRNCCEEWSSLEMLDEKKKCLKSARNIAEISNFLKMITSPSQNMSKLYQSWKLSQPMPSDSIIHWGDLLTYRQNFYEIIDNEKRENAATYLLKIRRELLNVAFAQKNSDAAKFLINDLKDDKRGSAEAEKICSVKVAIAKYNIMRTEEPSMNDDDRLIKLYFGLKKLATVIHNEARSFPSILIESYCCASEISKKLWIIFDGNREKGIEIPHDYQENIKKLIESPYEHEVDVVDSLKMYSEKQIKTAAKLGERLLKENYSAESKLLLCEVYLKMGKFYHHMFSSGIVTSTQIQIKIIKSIFRAIAQGSEEAKVYIPYILQLPDLRNNVLAKEFNNELNLIPEWMFLAYISQMLSSYDFENECYLDELLMKLATKYPNALFFPFKLSRDHYQNINKNRGMEKEQVSNIDDKVSSPTMNKFMNALQCLVLPIKMLVTHFQTFVTVIDSEGKSFDNKKFQDELRELIENVFERNNNLKGSSYGDIQKFRGDIENLRRMDFFKDRKLIVEAIQRLNNVFDQKMKRVNPSIELHKLCQWLADYKWCGDKDYIEIPSQYHGDVKPFVEQHVKIVRFETRLKIYKSKQLPVELKMFASDGQTYSFILKYGEDLRQDQRIQHILKLMCRQLSMDKNCKQNQLKLQTYQVVPINSNVGMLSVVSNAATILEYVELSGRQFFKCSVPQILMNNKTEFRDFLLGENMCSGWAKTYENGLASKTREQLVEKMEVLEATIPKDIFRKSLMNSAMTLETYYILRKNFVTSLASMNIAHWLLGIGDRHLGNILIDLQTGRLVGIDFGIAFGAAANLAVPELIPFRLTSHFTNVLEPLGVDGMIRKNMVHVLRCLRDYQETILICLEMFVNEPTIDWLLRSKVKSVGNAGIDQSLASSDWNPEARVRNVRRKLEGANPLQITKNELSISQVAGNETMLKLYEHLADGGDCSLRVNMKDDELSAEDQVSCLIDMATDKALLASVYLGFDPWF